MRFLTPALLFGGACILAACAGSKKSADRLPADMVISLGKGGGFTGLWHGYAIFANGRVESWDGRTAARSGVPSGQLPFAVVDSIWTVIREADLFERTDDSRGNITGHIWAVANTDTVSVWWSGGADVHHASHVLELLYTSILDQIGPHIASDR